MRTVLYQTNTIVFKLLARFLAGSYTYPFPTEGQLRVVIVVGREAFAQPDVVPPFRRDQVAVPLQYTHTNQHFE